MNARRRWRQGRSEGRFVNLDPAFVPILYFRIFSLVMKNPHLSDVTQRIAPHYSPDEKITPVTTSERYKTRVLTLVVIVTNVVGNVLLSRGMHDMGSVVGFAPMPYVHAILNPYVAAGVGVLALWMICDLALLSLADLSFVLPVTASAYVLIAILGHFLLEERVSFTRWVGIVVITLGVMLVGETPSRTTPEHHHREDGQ
jgi:uncharacterized membrane protein